MKICSPIPYKSALEHKSRLVKMLEVARATLSQRDLIYFERSLLNQIRAVDREIEDYQGETVNLLSPTWVTLGEFVINGRVLRPPDGTLIWNTVEAQNQSFNIRAIINFQQPSLFEVIAPADFANPEPHSLAVFNLHAFSHPSA